MASKSKQLIDLSKQLIEFANFTNGTHINIVLKTEHPSGSIYEIQSNIKSVDGRGTYNWIKTLFEHKLADLQQQGLTAAF